MLRMSFASDSTTVTVQRSTFCRDLKTAWRGFDVANKNQGGEMC